VAITALAHTVRRPHTHLRSPHAVCLPVPPASTAGQRSQTATLAQSHAAEGRQLGLDSGLCVTSQPVPQPPALRERTGAFEFPAQDVNALKGEPLARANGFQG
jgi:hypothetical protein